MITKFITFLTEKGIQFDTPDETLVKFSSDGLNFLFQYRKEDDPQYIRLLLPRIEDLKGDASDIAVFKRMIDVSSSIKSVKSIVSNGEVWLTCEEFLSSTENINQVFERMMAVLRLAYNHYASAAAKNQTSSSSSEE